jgi:hypothetical protein
MNERIKELAEQAGFEELGDGDWCSLNHPDVRAEHLERFADLVRQEYLEDLSIQLMKTVVKAVEVERENCAALCDEHERSNLYGVKECAKAIRARGVK